MVGPRMHPLCFLILQSCGIIRSSYKNLLAYLDHKKRGLTCMQEPLVKLTEQFVNIDQQIIIFTQEYNQKHR